MLSVESSSVRRHTCICSDALHKILHSDGCEFVIRIGAIVCMGLRPQGWRKI